MKHINLFGAFAIILVLQSCVDEVGKEFVSDKDVPAFKETYININKEISFINSRRFEIYSENLTASEKEIAIKRNFKFLNVIGEENFWFAGDYDLYAIYIYKEPGSESHVYSIKSKDGIMSAKLVVSPNFGTIDPDTTSEGKKMYYEGSSGFRFVSKKIVMSFKNVLDAAVLRKNETSFPSGKYGDPVQVLYYYDGQKYYLDSHETIDQQGVKMIDSLFRQSDIFKK